MGGGSSFKALCDLVVPARGQQKPKADMLQALSDGVGLGECVAEQLLAQYTDTKLECVGCISGMRMIEN